MSFAFVVLLAFFVLLGFLKSIQPRAAVPDTNGLGQDQFVSEKDSFVTPGAAGIAPDVLPTDPQLGPSTAPVTIIVFSDFQCPYCAETHELLVQLQRKYSQDVRIVWKDFPLPTHGFAMTAALAGRCASHQKLFWEYSHLVFQKLPSMDPFQTSEMFELLKSAADGLGMSKEDFQSCIENKRYANKVGDSFTQGLGADIDGVPYLFINTQPFSGQPTPEVLEAMVEAELQK